MIPAKMDNIPLAKMSKVDLEKLTENGIEFNKMGVEMCVPAYRIKYTNRTQKYGIYSFSGYMRERPYSYGKGHIRVMKPRYVFGTAEYDIEKRTWNPDDVRFIQFKINKQGQDLYWLVKNRILRWIGECIGAETRTLEEELGMIE